MLDDDAGDARQSSLLSKKSDSANPSTPRCDGTRCRSGSQRFSTSKTTAWRWISTCGSPTGCTSSRNPHRSAGARAARAVWRRLQGLRHFRPTFLSNLRLALATYPDARVERRRRGSFSTRRGRPSPRSRSTRGFLSVDSTALLRMWTLPRLPRSVDSTAPRTYFVPAIARDDKDGAAAARSASPVERS
jgi:hypothetical protein